MGAESERKMVRVYILITGIFFLVVSIVYKMTGDDMSLLLFLYCLSHVLYYKSFLNKYLTQHKSTRIKIFLFGEIFLISYCLAFLISLVVTVLYFLLSSEAHESEMLPWVILGFIGYVMSFFPVVLISSFLMYTQLQKNKTVV